jgi:hypothetical protein
MGEGKGSTLVHLLVVVLCLVAFGFAIAAERRRSTVSKDFDFHFQLLHLLCCNCSLVSSHLYIDLFPRKLIALFFFFLFFFFSFFFFFFFLNGFMICWVSVICSNN